METTVESEFISCGCGGHGLLLTGIITQHSKNNNIQLELSIFSRGQYPKKPSLKVRLLWAWNSLFKGTVHGDQVVLNEHEIYKFREYIKKVYNVSIDTASLAPKEE